jgi:hypothetical protein
MVPARAPPSKPFDPWFHCLDAQPEARKRKPGHPTQLRALNKSSANACPPHDVDIWRLCAEDCVRLSARVEGLNHEEAWSVIKSVSSFATGE